MPEPVKRLNKDDIMRIVSDVLSEKEDDQKEQLSEDFPMFAGKGDERSSLISNGFKIWSHIYMQKACRGRKRFIFNSYRRWQWEDSLNT
jgi:hypothetical protein